MNTYLFCLLLQSQGISYNIRNERSTLPQASWLLVSATSAILARQSIVKRLMEDVFQVKEIIWICIIILSHTGVRLVILNWDIMHRCTKICVYVPCRRQYQQSNTGDTVKTQIVKWIIWLLNCLDVCYGCHRILTRKKNIAYGCIFSHEHTRHHVYPAFCPVSPQCRI